MQRTGLTVGLCACVICGGLYSGRARAAVPLVETIDMNGSGDTADDMCVWLHPTDRTKSVILGSNKTTTTNGGIYAFGLDGGRADGAGSWGAGNWFDQGRKINNVDVRYNFQAGGETWDIVVGSNRTTDRIDVFRVATGGGGDFAGLVGVGSISTVDLGGDNPYGVALFHSKSLNTHYVVASSTGGAVAQWALAYEGGSITGTKVWQAAVSATEVEGIVADDENEVVYIAGENTALYRYRTVGGVISDAGRVTVDTAGGAHLTADIEGMTIYTASGGQGYLIASSQGSDQFVVYDRQFAVGAANDHVVDFTIGANGGAGIDAVSGTDGIDVTSANLGGLFDDGMFLAHDASNTGGTISNIKLVDWADVADEGAASLTIDTTWDPRSVPEPTSAALIAAACLLARPKRRRDGVRAPLVISDDARTCPSPRENVGVITND